MLPEHQSQFGPVSATLANGSQVVIRPLTAADGGQLAAFYRTVPREDLRFYANPLDRQAALDKAARANAPNEVILVLATPDARRIGGYAWYRWADEASQESGFGICVSPDFQGIGAGRALMARAAEIARRIGPPVMTLTVQVANERAVALYRKMGFVIRRTQDRPAVFDFPPEPEYVMCRTVR